MLTLRSAGAFTVLLLPPLWGACSRAPTELPPGDAASAVAPGSATPIAPATRTSEADEWGTTADGGPTLFPLGPLPPDAPFQGRLTIQVVIPGDTDDPETTESARYNFTIKGKKARWDLFSRGGKGRPVGYRIYDSEPHKFYTVMRQPQLYVTDEASLNGDAGAPKAWKFTPFALEPKGKVQDYPCDIVNTQDDQYEYHACLASGLPTLPLQLLGSAMALAVPFGAVLEKKGLYPLLVVVRPRSASRDAGLKPLVAKLTLLQLERGLVPDVAFELPHFPVTETPRLIAPTLHR
jgi:hypothetical protein